MKKMLTLFACGLLTASVAQAIDYYGPTKLSRSNLDAVTIYGPAQLSQVKADSLTVNGPLKFNNLEVTKSAAVAGPVEDSSNGKFEQLAVTGPLTAEQVQTNELTVTGPVKIRLFNVQGDTDIIGPLDAAESQFQDLTVNADQITLENVKVGGDIVIKNDDRPQTLYIKGKSVVEGGISFDSGKGTVVVDSSSEVKGEVKGATVDKK